MTKKTLYSFIALLSLITLSTLQAADIVKKKLAVSDFVIPESALSVSPLSLSPSEESTFLTEKLIQSLTKDPSFEIVKANSPDADFTIAGDVQLVQLQKQKDKSNEISGRTVLSLLITDTKTSKLVYAKKLVQASSGTIEGNLSQSLFPILDNLNEKTVCQLVNSISQTIFPIKITSTEGAYVNLDKGEESNLHKGTILAVVIPNVPVIDYKTNEVTKDSEYQVGELKITEVKPKVSKAQVLSYSIPLDPGTLCRTIVECK